MNVERLEKLAEVLDLYPYGEQTKFDLSDWGQVKGSCGTAVCAIGTACWLNTFEGLGYRWDEDGSMEPFCYTEWPVGLQVKLTGWPAVEYFFNLSSDLADWLFAEENYNKDTKPSDVALRIRCLIEASGQETPTMEKRRQAIIDGMKITPELLETV